MTICAFQNNFTCVSRRKAIRKLDGEHFFLAFILPSQKLPKKKKNVEPGENERVKEKEKKSFVLSSL